MPEVALLTPDGLRPVRLAAQADNPRAFASTRARESAFTEADRRSWLSGRALFAATADPAPDGHAGGGDDPAGPEPVSRWLAPGHRGTGSAESPVAAVAAHARSGRIGTVTARIPEDDPRVRRCHDRLGRGGPDPVHPEHREIELTRSVP